MKLDIYYIEGILKAVEAHPKARIMQRDLMEAIGANKDNEEDVDKFYYHMKRIEDVSFLDSTHYGEGYNDGFGFNFNNLGMSLFSVAEYELTWHGCEFLDAMRSETIKEKLTIWFKDMTLEQIKIQTPVLLTRLISQGSLL